MTHAKAYYAGGARVVIGGIPIRLARKPSARDLAWSQRHEVKREKQEKRSPLERAKDAIDAIELYAAMLEISVTQAKARIAAQRQHVLANPVIDQSLEYDL